MALMCHAPQAIRNFISSPGAKEGKSKRQSTGDASSTSSKSESPRDMIAEAVPEYVDGTFACHGAVEYATTCYSEL